MSIALVKKITSFVASLTVKAIVESERTTNLLCHNKIIQEAGAGADRRSLCSRVFYAFNQDEAASQEPYVGQIQKTIQI